MPILSVTSQALVSSFVLKDENGTHHSTHVTIDASAPTATYYVQLLHRSSAVPADGAVTHFHTPRPVLHTSGTPDEVVFDDTPDGTVFSKGLSVVLSSTELTKTEAGAYMLVDGGIS